ncbi:hypothetical protein B0H19DRAFT_1227035 [Mycena capillaripes]|nr:hypothetical protein B0H19DRAFT_1227035 [Mycena capillaripes]
MVEEGEKDTATLIASAELTPQSTKSESLVTRHIFFFLHPPSRHQLVPTFKSPQHLAAALVVASCLLLVQCHHHYTVETSASVHHLEATPLQFGGGGTKISCIPPPFCPFSAETPSTVWYYAMLQLVVQ